MYCMPQKKLALLDRRKGAPKGAAVGAPQDLGQRSLHFLHFLRACRVPIQPKLCHGRPHDAPVVRIVHALHQTIRLETIHELRDV